ncbi:hypothetical protein [Actinophytocola sediminis]
MTVETESTIVSYQDRTVAAETPARPSASATTATASGPANADRSSAPCGGNASTRSRAVASRNGVNRSRTGAGRNGGRNGARWRACAGPSRESMLGPTTRAVENRGSSTVNVAGSRITATARS